MFGRQRKQPGGEGARIAVDATLEGDIARVEQAAADYLENPTDATRRELLGALETLDDQTQQSDAYGESVIGSAALGYASKGEVLGETSLDSVVDDVPGAELRAQFALVKAAKDEVRGPTSDTLVSLRSALADLARTRNQGPAKP
jgi:hypothetical protein